MDFCHFYFLECGGRGGRAGERTLTCVSHPGPPEVGHEVNHCLHCHVPCCLNLAPGEASLGGKRGAVGGEPVHWWGKTNQDRCHRCACGGGLASGGRARRADWVPGKCYSAWVPCASKETGRARLCPHPPTPHPLDPELYLTTRSHEFNIRGGLGSVLSVFIH